MQRLRLITISPEPEALLKALGQFAQQEAWFTALEDSALVALHSLSQELRLDDIEVIAFPHALRRVLRMANQVVPQQVNGYEMDAIVRELTAELDPHSPFGKVRALPGFHDVLKRSLSTLRHWRWTPEQIQEAGKERGSQKLVTLGELAERFEDALVSIERTHSSHVVQQLLKVDRKLLPIPQVVVLLGRNPQPDYLDALKVLPEFGAEVTAILVDSQSHPKLQTLVELSLGEKASTPKSTHWTREIFSRAPVQPSCKIELIETSDKVAEIEWALRRCAELESTLHPHRIVILANDRDTYIPLLVSLAPRFLGSVVETGQPKIDARIPVQLLSNPFAGFVHKLLVSLSSPNIRALLELLPHSFLGLESDQVQHLTESGRSLLKGPVDTWQVFEEMVLESLGLKSALGSILAWRNEVTYEPASYFGWHQRLSKLLRKSEFGDRINSEKGWQVEMHRSALTAILRSAGGSATVADRNTVPVSFSTFVQFAQSVWEREEFTYPTRSNGVRVVINIEEIGLADAVIVLGSQEGSWPVRRREDAILFDSDLEQLHDHNPSSSAIWNSRDTAAMQRDRFIALCATAREFLIFTTPNFEDQESSLVAAYVRDLVEHGNGRQTIISSSQAVPSRENCRTTHDLKLRNAFESEESEIFSSDLSNQELIERMKIDPTQPVNLDRLSLAASCPFRSAVKHVLSAFPRSTPNPMYLILGDLQAVPVHLIQSREELQETYAKTLDNCLKSIENQYSEAQVTALKHLGERSIENLVNLILHARNHDFWTGDDYFGSVKLADTKLKKTIKLEGEDIELDFRMDGHGWLEDIPVIRHIQASELSTSDDDRPRHLKFAIETSLLASGKCPYPGVEILTTSGEHQLFRVGSAGSTEDNSKKAYKQVKGLYTNFVEVKEDAKVGLDRLRRGSVKPISDTYCNRCRFQALCRATPEYSDERKEDFLLSTLMREEEEDV